MYIGFSLARHLQCTEYSEPLLSHINIIGLLTATVYAVALPSRAGRRCAAQLLIRQAKLINYITAMRQSNRQQLGLTLF
jgi:hypothetical protein